jgi:hypothetical protein
MAAPTTDLTPTQRNLVLYAGDGATLEITINNSATNAPENVTGEVKADIKATKADPAPAASFSADMAEAATGTVKLHLASSDSQDLGDFTGVWDCQWTPSGSDPIKAR